MDTSSDKEYGKNVVANGRNWNYLKLITQLQHGRQGHYLTELKFLIKNEEVLVIAKKDSPQGPVVAFVVGVDLDSALYNLAYAIKTKSLNWKPDKWRTTRSDKKANSG